MTTRNKIGLDKYESENFSKTDIHMILSLKVAGLAANTRWHMCARIVELSLLRAERLWTKIKS